MSDQETEQTGRPSQAEGDRATMEESLGETPTTSEDETHPDGPAPADKPSQAEGE